MKDDIQLLTRWFDGDLAGDELHAFENRLDAGELDALREDIVGHNGPGGEPLASRDGFERERDAVRKAGSMVRATLRGRHDLDDPAAFNRGILDRIRDKA